MTTKVLQEKDRLLLETTIPLPNQNVFHLLKLYIIPQTVNNNWSTALKIKEYYIAQEKNLKQFMILSNEQLDKYSTTVSNITASFKVCLRNLHFS